MARIETDPNYSSPTFSRATAGTDIFKKEDVQSVAAALSTHDHSTGKGLAIGGASLKDSSVTSAKIADGTIATADLANNAVTNAKLGTDTARLNLLTNGGFEIRQRGTGSFTGSGTYTMDRWVISLSGSDTMTVNWDNANNDVGSQFCAACAFTLGTGAGNTTLYQKIEDFSQLRTKTISFSIRVRTATANAVRVSIADSTGRTYSSGYHTGDGTYQTLTVTRTIVSNATLVYAEVDFAASSTAYLDNAMLVVGSVAADYAPLHPADDLARCLRYYEITSTGAGQGMPCASAYGAAGMAYRMPLSFAAKKSLNPTMTIGPGVWTLSNCSTPIISAYSLDGYALQSTVTALGTFSFAPGAGTATIAAEANP